MAALDAETKKRMLNVMEILHRKASPVAVYLFGSRINGTWDEWSDYDLAVFIEGAEEWDIHRHVKFSGSIQKEAGWDIEPHVFAASQINNPEPGSFSQFVLKHGVKLNTDELAM